jgi:alkylation response protein AidB-like acyl-CoA dehydrogenase
MVAQVESVQNWLENITYQMTKMGYKEQSVKLAGPIALLKLMCTRVAHNVSDEACQIFGGRGITKTGMGRIIEGFQRTYKFGAILGGSEEVMAVSDSTLSFLTKSNLNLLTGLGYSYGYGNLHFKK